VGSDDFLLATLALSRAFDPKAKLSRVNVSFHNYSPSEQEVLRDFANWVTQLNEQQERTSNGIFSYTNLNEGITLVFVGWFGYEDYALETIDGLERWYKNENPLT
jgi:hypothetical protein